MKKIVALLLALVCVFSFSSCGEKRGTGLPGESSYYNEDTRILFELPKGWKFCGKGNIEEMVGITPKVVQRGFYTSDDVQEEVVLEMMAINYTTKYDVAVLMQKTSIDSEKEYMKAVYGTVSDFVYHTNSDGIHGKPVQATIGGDIWKGQEVSCNTYVTVYYETYFCKKFGDYFVTILIGTTGENPWEEIVSNFSIVKK